MRAPERWRRVLALGVLLGVLPGCGGVVDEPAADAGRRWFGDPALSSEPSNRFSCATCHAVADPAEADRRRSGHDLRGVATRPRWWNGQVTRLLDAVNACVVQFQRGAPLAAEDERGRALYAYLVRLSPERVSPEVSFSIQRVVTSAPSGGDATRGAGVYRGACGPCHGDRSTGAGRLDPAAPILPEEGLSRRTAALPMVAPALLLTEKIRHGALFGLGGHMPFFSLEALPDADLADLLAHLVP